MRQRVANLESEDDILGSNNFGKFMGLLESSDNGWIEEINSRIEG